MYYDSLFSGDGNASNRSCATGIAPLEASNIFNVTCELIGIYDMISFVQEQDCNDSDIKKILENNINDSCRIHGVNATGDRMQYVVTS